MQVVELLEIFSPVGTVRFSTSPRTVTFDGHVWRSAGGIVSIKYNTSTGGQPGGVSIAIAGIDSSLADQLAIDIGWGFPVNCYVADSTDGNTWSERFKVSGRLHDSVYSDGLWTAELTPQYAFILPKNEKYAPHVNPAFDAVIEGGNPTDNEFYL